METVKQLVEERELTLLKEALEALDRGAFLFAICEPGRQRKELMSRLEEKLREDGHEVWKETLSLEESDLTWKLEKKREEAKGARPAVFVDLYGLEVAGLVETYPMEEADSACRVFKHLNAQRERLGRLGLPIAFWLSWRSLSLLERHAGDLFAARSGLFYLEKARMPTYMLMEEKQVLEWLLERRPLLSLPAEEVRRRVELHKRMLSQEEEKKEPHWPKVAFLHAELALLYRALGERQLALEHQSKAVELYRSLSLQNPDAFLPELARGLNNLGVMLSELGREEEALKATEKAVRIQRKLAEKNSDAFLPDLARSLSNLGARLSKLGRREEALKPTEKAMRIQRKLAEKKPDAFLPDLAGSLNNLGIALSELGREEEALKATEEAVRIRRKLTEGNPDAFLPDLAGSLNNFGIALSELGRREEALKPTEEAVEIYKKLAEKKPDAFLPNLARSLGVHGMVLQSLGRHREALLSFTDGLRAILPLLKAYLDAFAPLASALLQDYLRATEEAGMESDRALVEAVSKYLSQPSGSR